MHHRREGFPSGGLASTRWCIPAKAFLETAAVNRTSPTRRTSGSTPRLPHRRLLRRPEPQGQDRRRSRQGHRRADEDAQGHGVRGLGASSVAGRRSSSPRPTLHRDHRRRRRSPRRGLGSSDRSPASTAVARSCRATKCSCSTTCRPASPSSAAARSVRVRLDLRRPRRHGDDPRGPAEDPSGLDDDLATVVVRSFKKNIDIRTGAGQRPHPERQRRHHGPLR